MYRRKNRRSAFKASANQIARILLEPLEERRMLSAITLQAFSTTDYSDTLSALLAHPHPAQGLLIRNTVTLANYYVTQGDSVEIDLEDGATYTYSDSPQAEENDAPPAASTPSVSAGVITVNGNGATVDLHNSGGQQEMISATGSANLTLYDMTIENGTFMDGGAVSVSGSASLSTLAVTFDHNMAAGNQLGAALNGGGYAGADADGGAIVANTNGSININSSNFDDNSATGATGSISGGDYGAQGGAGLGGAVSIQRAQGLTISYSTFTANSAAGGATANNGDGLGPLPNDPTASYQDLTYAPAQGGALFVSSVGTVVLNNNTFDSNSANGRTGAGDWDDHAGEDGGLAEGGAIYLLNSSVNIASSSIIDSIAEGGPGGAAYDGADQGGKGGFAQGGGLFASSTALTTSGLTITGNQAIGGATGWSESGVLLDNGHPQTSPVIYSSAALGYGLAQGGGMFLSGAGSFNISGGSIQNNSAVGFTGENTFYQNNGEDGGSAEGGGLFVSLSGSNSGSINSVNMAQNAANGGAGGNSGGNSQDLSGKGGDAQGGAIYLQSGGLSVNSGAMLGNSVTPGMDGSGSYGPVAAAPDPNNQFTPTLDPTRQGLAQGGALYLSGGSLAVTGTQVQSNLADAAAAAAYEYNMTSIGRTGGSAQGGAFYFNNATSSISFSGALLLANIASGGNGGFAAAGTFDDTQPTGGSGGDAAGGAIYLATGGMSISGSELAQNQAYSGQGGVATSGIAGSNGTAYGGGIYANGSVTLSSSLLAYDTAWGGPEASLAGVSGGGDGRWGGGSGGNGGSAFGGGLYIQYGALNANFAIWELNEAFGGNGGAGYDGTDVGDSGGTPGGGGGSGGSAYGGGVYAGVSASMTLTNSVLKQNLVLGGLGGRGGNGNGNADNPADNGGNGGNGGSGGNAYGGAIAAADADPTYDLPDLNADVLTNSRLLDNQAGGGDGGAGGNSGFGGNGDTDGGSIGGRYHGGSGGVSGVGGAGGEAIGGAIWDNGAAFTADQNAIDYNGVTGGWGGDGGYGGAGGDGEDNSVSILGVSSHYDSYGGFGGNGGNGGNGGDALGGGIAVIGGSFVSNKQHIAAVQHRQRGLRR
jgi:hypothetical protein